jgi:hypothetical protein
MGLVNGFVAVLVQSTYLGLRGERARNVFNA